MGNNLPTNSSNVPDTSNTPKNFTYENVTYKSINIQKLSPVERRTIRYHGTSIETYWKGKLCECHLFECKCNMIVLCTMKNSDANTYFNHNPFFGAF